MIAVALMTEAGFAGNLRYVALPAALVCVLAGAGWVELCGILRRWAPVAAVAAAGFWRSRSPPRSCSRRRITWRTQLERIDYESRGCYGPNLVEVIAKAGGEEADQGVRAGVHRAVPGASRSRWYLHLDEQQVAIFPFGPGHDDRALLDAAQRARPPLPRHHEDEALDRREAPVRR